MIFLVKVFLGLFLFFLFLFFKVEFAVQPHLPSRSDLKLIASPPPATMPKQVVLIIIDSLRYDYRDRLDFVKNTMNSYPQSTFLAKSTVGNPTMTTQRIESMMTGSQIFSSGNILKTFLASKVEYDNLISQLNIHNKSSAIFGDNTWVKLFDFPRSEICVNTFDVHDLDTCDKVVYDNLPGELFRGGVSNFSSSLIIAHLLGIDHVGHSRSTINDTMMEVKMNEISKFIERMFEEADEGTVFLVTGDHGMREDGNHGGTSIVQVQTFLFGYSKGTTLYQEMNKKTITHSDITTTLSILLDIPLPNNAIGYPILNLLPRQVAQKSTIVQINKNLYKHFSSMLSFYSLPLTVEEMSKYDAKLDQKSEVQEMEILVQFLSHKLMFLKYSSPDPTRILTIACLLSLFVVCILLYTFSKELMVSFTLCNGKILAMLFCEGLPMFTLFISYFGWSAIQQLSDALISGFLVAAVFGILLNVAIRNKLLSILSVLTSFVILAQIEPDKSNDYKPSSLRVAYLNQLVSNKIFWGGASSFLMLYYIKTTLEQCQQMSTAEHPSSRPQVLTVAKLIIAFLSYTNYFFTHLLQKPIYQISMIQTFAILGYIAILSFGSFQSTERNTSSNARFLIINFLSVFMGPHFPLIVIVCLFIQRQVASCYNFSIIMSVLAKCVWWWLGNRYQYSGVDILKTYVYSESYAIVLNGISLLIYLNSPFILNFVFVNSRLLSLKTQIQRYLMEGETTQYRWKLSLKSPSEEQRDEPESYREDFIVFMENSNMKYAGVLMLGLVSSIWTTLYNNEKILFTVVCVPVLVLITLITLSTLALVISVSCFYGRRRKSEYHRVSLQHL